MSLRFIYSGSILQQSIQHRPVCGTLSGNSNLDFYVSMSMSFSGLAKTYADSQYVVIGVPYDVTSSYRSGSRFGPAALREASLNIETYSLRSETDLEDIKIADMGDMHVVSDPCEMVERVRLVVKDVIGAGKVPVLLGGEHLITLGAIKALPNDVALVDFDAHLDLREAYMGEEYSHATFMRRAIEIISPKNVFYVGIRAVSKDELQFSREHGLTFVDARGVRPLKSSQLAQSLKSRLAGFRKIYITVDADVLDPAYAPAVGNPEADGLSPDDVLTLLGEICDQRVVGMDLVEIAPHYDTGITSVLGARIIFEVICAIEKSRKLLSQGH